VRVALIRAISEFTGCIGPFGNDILIRSFDTYTENFGRGGALVDSTPFVRRIVGPNPALTATLAVLGQVLYSQLPVALRRETPTQYPCCVWSASA